MLSFFRKKSTNDIAPVDGIVTAFEQMSPTSTSPRAVAVDAARVASDSGAETMMDSLELAKQLGYGSLVELKETIYDCLRTIKDPEKPQTLEDLNVVYEDGIFVKTPTHDNVNVIRVEFNPTVPHCSLATLIGLCIRVKIERSIPHQLKLDIYIKKGTHSTEDEINKQINDKERIAAAMENPNLRTLVEDCIKEED